MTSIVDIGDIKRFVRDVPDFPKPGILFRDITPLLGAPEAFGAVIQGLCDIVRSLSVDAIIGIESRGFLFGAPVAHALKVPFIPVRKPGKLPAQRMSMEYSLEYGKNQLDIHVDALKKGQSTVIIDDLLATGGTAHAAAKLVELVGGKVAALIFVIELLPLKGRDVLQNYLVKSLLQY